MLLDDYFRSSASYRVRIALNRKGLLDHQQRSPAFAAAHPDRVGA